MEEKTEWVERFRALWKEREHQGDLDDPAHDLSHLERVYQNALFLTAKEGGRLSVILPAIWFHDWVQVPKNHPDRSRSSILSAEAAVEILKKWNYPESDWSSIFHAIEAHSFSAGLVAQTLEAKIVQDADRLDALGAIGIARLFSTTGTLKRPFYSSTDIWCEEQRVWDDRKFALDHFYVKILNIAEQMQTKTAQQEAQIRKNIVLLYLQEMRRELDISKILKGC